MKGKETWKKFGRHFIPNAGTIALVLVLLWVQQAGALGFLSPESSSTTTISYQGRLADAGGTPITGTLGMTLRIYNVSTGGSPLWSETYPGVQVSDGLFHILLGSITPIPNSLFNDNDTLYLGLTVGADDEMAPREQLASAPYAMTALTVPDDSITSEKIANDAVGSAQIAAGAIGSTEIADGAVGTSKIASAAVSMAKIANGAISTAKIADGAVTQAKAPFLVESVLSNTQMQYGSARATCTEPTDMICVDIDFNPDFPVEPFMVLQPVWQYTTHVRAFFGAPCGGNTCRLCAFKTDGANWSPGQYQDIRWIAVRER